MRIVTLRHSSSFTVIVVVNRETLEQLLPGMDIIEKKAGAAVACQETFI